MLIHKTANKFDGINPEAVRAYNKSHISKTTVIFVVEMDFEYILENGGREINIFQISQSEKVIKINLVVKNDVIIKRNETNIKLIVM